MLPACLVLAYSILVFAVPQSTSFVNWNSTTSSAAATIPWGPSYDNFLLLPSDQAGSCDIYGALCQTGTVTVSLGLGQATSTAVVPCSSYLSAQSSWISLYYEDEDESTAPEDSWVSSFVRSPECTTLAGAAYENDGIPASSLSPLSGCPNNASGVLGPLTDYLPFGIETFFGGHYYRCCGECTLNVPALRLLYFPDPSLSCNQLNATNSTITAQASWDSTLPVTAVFSGYTFTSPSLYLQVLGTANVSDYCGPVGSQYTSVFIPLPSGALSSYSWDVPIGSSFTVQPNFFSAPFTKAVQVSDIQCPTWGIASELTAATDYGYQVVGPPFNPLYEPPSQIIDLDPAWQSCTYFNTDGDDLASWAIFDPPYALTPAGQLGPVSVDPKTTSSLSSGFTATPAQSPPSVLSTATQMALQSAPDLLPASEASSTGMAQSSASSRFSYEASGSQPTQTASVDPATGGPVSPSFITSNTLTSVIPDPGIGGIIYSAFGGTPITLVTPSSVPLQSPSSPIQNSAARSGGSGSGLPQSPNTVLTVDGSALTIYPSKISIGGSAIAYGDPGITLAGTPISIGPNGILVGTNSLTPPAAEPQIPTTQPSPATDNPAIVVDGTTLQPNGVGLVVSGVPITLEESGILLIGSSTININPLFSSLSPPPRIFTIAGDTFTANPSVFSIDGTTIVAGLTGVTISGTPISLATGGFLLVGTSTINLNAPVPTAPAVLTIGTNAYTYTPESSSHALVIGTQTLTSGGSITVSGGDVLSLAPGGTAVIVVAPGASTFTESLNAEATSTAINSVGSITLSGVVTSATATGGDQIHFASKGAGRRGAMLGNLAVIFVLVCWVVEAV